MDAFVMWFLINVIIPANLCISTGGAYVPDDPQAQAICYSVIGFPGGTFQP